VPMLNNKTEPLLAYYSKRISPAMETAMLNNKKGLKDILSNKKVKYISTREIKDYDPEAKSFINLNTVDDIKYYLMSEGVSKTGSQKCLADLAKRAKSYNKKGGKE